MINYNFISVFLVTIDVSYQLNTLPNVPFINNSHSNHTFKIVHWRFDKSKNYVIVASFLLVVVVMRIFYYQLSKITKYVPQSTMVMLIGIVFGILIKFALNKADLNHFKLTPALFFYVLLPPIILESSYSLYHRNFLDNILSILLLAVLGTMMSFLLIGFGLYGLGQMGWLQNLKLSLTHSLLFSSFIVSIDPVAVLAIIKEIRVNEDLYYLIFGESLFNNAIIVVLYKLIQQINMTKKFSVKNIGMSLILVFAAVFGGFFIGVTFGIMSCFIIKRMDNKHYKSMEPLLLISMGYVSYLFAELFGWSGIISMIVCGLLQAGYALPGMSYKSNLILKRIMKMLASISESVIFLFLGVELFIEIHHWAVNFLIFSLVFCIISRFVVIFSLSGIINFIHASMRKIPLREKIIISYGGLRGAVAFSLAVLLNLKIDDDSAITSNAILTTTLIIIIFTTIFQGITIKPLVNYLRISKNDMIIKIGLFKELNDSVLDSSTKGIEAIIGHCGRYLILTKLENLSKIYLHPRLQRTNYNRGKFVEMNDKINNIIMSSRSIFPDHKYLKNLPNSYKQLLNTLNEPFILRKEKTLITFPLCRNTIFFKRNSLFSKSVKQRMPYLYRASISDCGSNNNSDQRRLLSRISYLSPPIDAKRFSLQPTQSIWNK